MKCSKSLQNLKQGRGPLSAYYGKKYYQSIKRFGDYGFPPFLRFFETRTVSDVGFITRRNVA